MRISELSTDNLSLYGRYILEREGKFIVEDQRGFATYQYLESACYIENIYVAPEFRKLGSAAEYADTISELARKRKFTQLLGSVAPNAKNSTTSMSVLLAYGFKLHSSDSNIIYFIKGL